MSQEPDRFSHVFSFLSGDLLPTVRYSVRKGLSIHSLSFREPVPID